ncbi:MAG TPA: hypothetical protein ENF17_07330 [Candidatus Aminicenantes bacterium]|nr:hypothetical protein [Candidatus Aminicenantes bacterium]
MRREAVFNKYLIKLTRLIFLYLLIGGGVLALFSCSSSNHTSPSINQAEAIHLTICYPSVGSLRALTNLRQKGLLALDNLVVQGVYHVQEKTDYQDSQRFLEENNIDWINLRAIKGEISPEDVFKKNSLSEVFAELFHHSDGLIFFGGPDIPPGLYGQKSLLLTSIRDPYRHYFELSFLFHLLGGHQDPDFSPLLAEDPEFPILGICLGAQSMNVATGGTLVQDIWSEIYGQKFLEEVIELGRENWHTNPWAKLHPEMGLLPYFLHPITWDQESFLAQILGFPPQPSPFIMSAHHQAVSQLGKGFQVAATSLDGKVIEAIAHEQFPHVLGLQFHPEFPILYDETRLTQLAPEEEKINIPNYLRRHFPSLEFHQKIWSWWSKILLESSERHRSQSISWPK